MSSFFPESACCCPGPWHASQLWPAFLPAGVRTFCALPCKVAWMLLPSASWQVTQVSSPTKLLDCAGSADGGGVVASVAAGALCAVSAAAGCGAGVLPPAAITPTVAHQTRASAITSVVAGKPSLRGVMSVGP